MGFQKFHVGHAGSLSSHNKKRASSSSCLSGGFYKSPASGASINSLDKLNITWDTSCLTPAGDKADIYLYAPSAASPRLHLWQDVTYSSGSYQAEIMPRWWNSTSSIQLQLLIIQSGDAPFMATLPAGPVFTATYSAPSSGSTPASADTSLSQSDSGITNVSSSSSSSSSSHLSGGKIAAAVIMPLLVVAALAAFFWIRRKRAQGKVDRKRWSEKIDQRMSVVSADWQSMSAAGASAAIRQSMAIRASMALENQDPRTSSYSYSNVNNLAGMGVGVAPGGGVGGFYIQGQNDPISVTSMPVPNVSAPEMAQLRPGLRSSAFSAAAAATRTSRISFAAEPTIPGRPSGESKRSIYERERPSIDSRRSAYSQNTQSRAFHYDGEMPPMPEGAAERASQFYMAGRNSSAFVGGINPAMYNLNSGMGMRTSHMNVSSSSLGDGSMSRMSHMSRMSRFDEVYGEYEYDHEAEAEAGDGETRDQDQDQDRDQDQDQEDADADAAQMMSPKQMSGPAALTTDDIKQRIGIRRVGGQASQNASFDAGYGYGYDDVGPALSMMRAQDQEDYFNSSSGSGTGTGITVADNIITFPTPSYHPTSETLFTTSPSPDSPSFPAFPMPSLTGAVLPLPTSPIGNVEGASGSIGLSSYTGMAPPAAAMSPDDMLRAYADRSKAMSMSGAGRGVTSPLAINKPLYGSEGDAEAGAGSAI